MNQNIVRSTQYRTGHTQGKTDLQPRLHWASQFKYYTTSGDIPGDGGNLALAGGEHHGQRNRKTHCATHFLLRINRPGTNRRPRQRNI
jgi:hypothetical protein